MWDEEFKVLHHYGYIAKDKSGVPRIHTSHRNCLRPTPEEDGAQCILRCRRWDGRKWTNHEEVLRGMPGRDNPWWAERSTFNLPFEDFNALEQEEALLKRSLAMAGKMKEAADVTPAVFETMRHCSGEHGYCRYHSELVRGLELLDKEGVSDRDKAMAFLPVLVRPSKWLPKIPTPGHAWSWDDLQTGWAIISKVAIKAMKSGHEKSRAFKYAYAKMAEYTQGEFFDYSNWNSPKAVGGSKSTKELIRLDQRKALKGLVGPSEANRVYKHLKGVFKDCPVSMGDLKEGTFHANLLMCTAMTVRGKEVEHEKSWVRCGQVDMSAVEFNQLPYEDRKYLLGCRCTTCLQEKVFELDLINGKYVVRVQPEVLIREDLDGGTADKLADLTAVGESGISQLEMDELRNSFTYVARSDPYKYKDEQLVDYYEGEDEDEGESSNSLVDYEIKLVDWVAIYEDLRAIQLCGPVWVMQKGSPEWATYNRMMYFKHERYVIRNAKGRVPEPEQNLQPVPKRRIKVSPTYKGGGDAILKAAEEFRAASRAYKEYVRKVYQDDHMVSWEVERQLKSKAYDKVFYSESVRKEAQLQIDKMRELKKAREEASKKYFEVLEDDGPGEPTPGPSSVEVATTYWKQVPNIRGKLDALIVKVSNTAKGYEWDVEMPSAYPEWKDINNLRNGKISMVEFLERYRKSLTLRKDALAEEWCNIVSKADGRPIVLVCHEKNSKECHRTALYHHLVDVGLIVF